MTIRLRAPANPLMFAKVEKSICYNAPATWEKPRRRLFENMEMKMTKRQAAKLNVGDYVTWQEEMQFTTPQAISASTGEIVEIGYAQFKVRWGDGLEVVYRKAECPNVHLLA